MSTAAATKMIKPPLQVFGIDGRYACALYSAATKMKQLEAVEKDLTTLQTQFKTDVKLRDILINPTIKRSLMASALKDVASKSSYSQATGNFLESLAENGRLNKVDQIINAFKLIMAAHRGDVVCEVISAKPLDSSQTKQLEGVLKVSLSEFETRIKTHNSLSFFSNSSKQTRTSNSQPRSIPH